MTGETEYFDIVIVGGGVTGFCLALALQQTQFSVLLLDNTPARVASPLFNENKSGFRLENVPGSRVVSLNPRSQRLLSRLGVWTKLSSSAVCPFSHMLVWDQAGTGRISLDATMTGTNEMGHIVDNDELLFVLQQRLGPGVARFESTVKSVCREGEACRIETENGSTIVAGLVVGADGSRSTIRTQLGIPVAQWSYHQSAFVTEVMTQKPHGHVARQCFTREGPLAFLPLNRSDGHLCSIVWSAMPEFVDELHQLEEETLCQRLASGIDWDLGEVVAVGPTTSFPLVQRHARSYVGDNFALIGDAAHAIHPLAGQGLNLGLGDVDRLAIEIAQGELEGLAPASKKTLNRYQRARQPENLGMTAAMELMKRLFATDDVNVTLLRNTGLKMVQESRLVKQQMMRLASGDLV